MISDDARSFLRQSLRTVWTLELLLIMRRDPNRSWDAASLVTESRSSDLIVQEGLAALRQAGLVMEGPVGVFQYSPAAPVVDGWAQEITAAYVQAPSRVIKELFSAPASNVQSFADAFRIKRSD